MTDTHQGSGAGPNIEDVETGWLIERKALAPDAAPGQHPLWWAKPDRWTTDPNRAHRFPTREDAVREIAERSGIAGVHSPFGVATEHVWINRIGAAEWEYIGYQERQSSASRPPAQPGAHQELVDELRRAATAIHIAVEPSVATSIASLFERAATALAGMGPDWERIAAYVATVALKAHMRGFSAAYETLSVPIDRDAQKREADVYIASGFDADTVRRFHPEGRLAGDRATVVRDFAKWLDVTAQTLPAWDNYGQLADRYLSWETP